MTLAQRLHEKGWSPAEIEHAMHHLQLAEERKHPLVKFTDKSTYWLYLFAVVISIGAMSEFLFPFLRFVPKELSIIITAMVGSVFGVLYAHVLHDLDRLAHSHHVFILAVTVVCALAWSWYASHSVLFGAIFCVMFAVQYLYYWWRR
jgi:hypothetical protein